MYRKLHFDGDLESNVCAELVYGGKGHSTLDNRDQRFDCANKFKDSIGLWEW